MSWEVIARSAVERYISDPAVRDLVLSEIKGGRPSDRRPHPRSLVFEAVREERPGHSPRYMITTGPYLREEYQ